MHLLVGVSVNYNKHQWAVRLSWLEMPIHAHFFRRATLTRKVGQTVLVFGMRSGSLVGLRMHE